MYDCSCTWLAFLHTRFVSRYGICPFQSFCRICSTFIGRSSNQWKSANGYAILCLPPYGSLCVISLAHSSLSSHWSVIQPANGFRRFLLEASQTIFETVILAWKEPTLVGILNWDSGRLVFGGHCTHKEQTAIIAFFGMPLVSTLLEIHIEKGEVQTTVLS